MGNALRTDIEQGAPFPVVGGGWITCVRKIPIPGALDPRVLQFALKLFF
jgi:hypothetical protein